MRGQSGVEGCIEQLSQLGLFLILVEKHSYTAKPPNLQVRWGLALSVEVGESTYLTETFPEWKEFIFQTGLFKPDRRSIGL